MTHRGRKTVGTYRFNGSPYLDPASICAVTIDELELMIAKFAKKLADPSDIDDKRWVKRWLQRLNQELSKKQEGLALKQSEKQKERDRQQRIKLDARYFPQFLLPVPSTHRELS